MQGGPVLILKSFRMLMLLELLYSVSMDMVAIILDYVQE